MTAVFATFFRGLVHIAIVTVIVALTWSVYIYRAPIAATLAPVTRLFQSESEEPARAAAVVPATPEPVAPPAANIELQPPPAGSGKTE